MKTRFKICFLVASLFFANTLFANSKIGIVSMETLMRDSRQSKQVQKNLQDEFKTRQDELKTIQTKLKKAFEELKRDKDVLSEVERRKKDKMIQKMQRDLQRQGQEYNTDYSSREREEINALIKTFKKSIDEIGKAEKYDLIFLEQATIFNTKGIEITQKVLKKLDSSNSQKSA